jgi:ATP/maltotriose-dependent transcriptional regulator MalT
VKSQAISVYRKLGVSARGEAIARAAAVGLTGAAAGRS